MYEINKSRALFHWKLPVEKYKTGSKKKARREWKHAININILVETSGFVRIIHDSLLPVPNIERGPFRQMKLDHRFLTKRPATLNIATKGERESTL